MSMIHVVYSIIKKRNPCRTTVLRKPHLFSQAGLGALGAAEDLDKVLHGVNSS